MKMDMEKQKYGIMKMAATCFIALWISVCVILTPIKSVSVEVISTGESKIIKFEIIFYELEDLSIKII